MRYNRYWKENHCIVGTDHTWQLGTFAAELTYEALPEEVKEAARGLLNRTRMAAVKAKNMPLAQAAFRLARDANRGVGGETKAWGSDEALSAVNGAMHAGVLSHLLDLEDQGWTGHPAAAIVPAAWFVGEEQHKSEEEILTAIVAAYEVYQRIAMAVQPTLENWKRKGWGQNSWQIFGAAIAAGKLYGFDARKFDQVIGVCCESSPLGCDFAVRTDSDFYYFEYGYRVRDGILAAKAVEKGIWNARDTLDEPACYYGVICDTPDTEWFCRELGKRYLICETAAKEYPANFFLQEAIHLLMTICEEEHLTWEEISEIRVKPAAEELWQEKLSAESGLNLQETSTLRVRQRRAADTIAEVLLKGQDAWLEEETNEVRTLASRIWPGEEKISLYKLYTALREGCLPETKVSLRTKEGRLLERKGTWK